MDQPADLTGALWRILGSVAEWVRFADAKAGAALSALAAVWTVVPRIFWRVRWLWDFSACSWTDHRVGALSRGTGFCPV